MGELSAVDQAIADAWSKLFAYADDHGGCGCCSDKPDAVEFYNLTNELIQAVAKKYEQN